MLQCSRCHALNTIRLVSAAQKSFTCAKCKTNFSSFTQAVEYIHRQDKVLVVHAPGRKHLTPA